MTTAADPERFDALSDELARAVLGHPALTGLALLGSASTEAASRRDEWSDHDFFAIAPPGLGSRPREDLSWLPGTERIVLQAREGEIGFVTVYDDGHVLEFAVADAAELAGALAEEATIVVDDEAGTTATLIAEAQARAAAARPADPRNDAGLVLVKLLIGVGRARRGEVLVAGAFVRQWAVQSLVRVLRARCTADGEAPRAAIDPMRRFEQDFPQLGAEIAAALEQPVEQAAQALLRILRARLEPGWPQFPTAAADAVERRLGW